MALWPGQLCTRPPGKVPWVFFAGAVCCLDGTINAPRYRDEVLAPYVLPLVQRRTYARPSPYIFMHDGASIHRAGVSTALVQQHNVRVLDWPSHSPDLNPVENLWASLARRVRQYGPSTKAELQQAVYTVWNEPDTFTLVKTLYESLPRRMQALRRSKGAHIRY